MGNAQNWNEGQAADTRPGNYYVAAQEAGKTYLMAGPYTNDHAAALAAVWAAKEAACNRDGRACFMAWGTVRVEGYSKPGTLNAEVGQA